MAVELHFAFRLLHLWRTPTPMILIPILVIKLGKDWLVDLTCLTQSKIKVITTERFKKNYCATTNQ